MRVRALVEAISQTVFGGDFVAPAFPVRKELSILGFSDQQIYARHLLKAVHYTNSYFHKPPARDVMNIESFRGATYDAVVCSEVLEHVNRPFSQAVRNLNAILKPGGILILSLPMQDGETIEYFPELSGISVALIDGKYVLSGTGTSGVSYRSNMELVFHGGPGTTVEMRLAGRATVERELLAAGFTNVEERRVTRPDLGIVWDDIPESISTSGGVVRGMKAGIWIAHKAARDPANHG
jgi:SAM-dependent methyltransferase